MLGNELALLDGGLLCITVGSSLTFKDCDGVGMSLGDDATDFSVEGILLFLMD